MHVDDFLLVVKAISHEDCVAFARKAAAVLCDHGALLVVEA